jgi:hypothetical protein
MSIRVLTVLLGVLAVAAPAYARVGETEARIGARYGASIGDVPTEAFGTMRGFALPGFVVGVKLVGGQSVMEMISRNDRAAMPTGEIEGLLDELGGRAGWIADASFAQPGWRRWLGAAGRLVAVYDTTRHVLYVSTREFYEGQARPDGSPASPSVPVAMIRTEAMVFGTV